MTRVRRSASADREEPSLALAATLHDPDAALLAEVDARLPALRAAYASIHVTTSPPTHRRVRTLLAERGVWSGTPRQNRRGPLYRDSLSAAAASGAARVHYLDFDRALHFARRSPRRLAALVSVLATAPLAVNVVGRTARAHASHQTALHATEQPLNRLLAAGLGLSCTVDFLAPSFALPAAMAGELARRSREPDSGFYGELPALLATAAAPQRALAYLECDDLDWETPDREAALVRRIGLPGYRRRFDTRAEWQMRLALARDILAGFTAALGRHPPGQLRVRPLAAPARPPARPPAAASR